MPKLKLPELIANAAAMRRQIESLEDCLEPLVEQIKTEMKRNGLAVEQGTDGSQATLVPSDRVEWDPKNLANVLEKDQFVRFCPPTPQKGLLSSFYDTCAAEVQAALRTCRKVTYAVSLRIQQPTAGEKKAK